MLTCNGHAAKTKKSCYVNARPRVPKWQSADSMAYYALRLARALLHFKRIAMQSTT